MQKRRIETIEEEGGKSMGCGCGGGKRIITNLKQLQSYKNSQQIVRKLKPNRVVIDTNSEKKQL